MLPPIKRTDSHDSLYPPKKPLIQKPEPVRES